MPSAVDNGGEFANSKFTETCSYDGINIKAAAEYLWSYDMVESNKLL